MRRFQTDSVKHRVRSGAQRIVRLLPSCSPSVSTLGIYIVTLLASLYIVVSLTGEMTGHFVWANTGQIVVGFGAASFAIRQGILARWSYAWLLLAAGVLLPQFAALGYMVSALVKGAESAPSWLFGLFLLTYPFLYGALFLLQRGSHRSRQRRGLEAAGGWLDFVIVLMAGGMAIVFLWLIPEVESGQSSSSLPVLTTANALADLLLLAAVTRYALSRMRNLPPVVTFWVVMGVIGALTGDVLIGAEEAGGGYRPGGLADAVYVFSLGAIAWGAYLASRRSLEPASESVSRAGSLAALLPFAAVLLCLGLLVAESLGNLRSPLGGVVLCTTVLVLAAVARQVLAAVENGRLQAARALHQSEKRFHSLVTNSSDVILVADENTVVAYATPSSERLLKVSAFPARRRRLIDLVHPELQGSALATVAACLDQPNGEARGEWLVEDALGGWRHFDVTIANLLEDETVQGLVFTMRDVEERVRFERELEEQIFYDPLTKLANRVLLRDRLEHALARASRTGEQPAILFADLDDFKLINDNFGHQAGDRLLVEVAGRLQAVLRSSDTAARLGGDEFAVLLEDTADVFQAVGVAEKVLECLREPFMVEDSRLTITVSIGIAGSGGDCDAEELLRNADIAMYSAKSTGKNRYEIFEQDMQVSIRSRLELQADLRRAIAEHEFAVYYQPIVEITTGQLVCLEALARWRHPNRGLLLPADFIPVAEKTGLINGLGQQVLLEACRQAKAWGDLEPNGRSLTVAVNLSPRQIREPTIVSMVQEALDSTGLNPSQLVLEVTEAALIEDEQLTSTKLWAIKQLGVLLSIDDFGTGYSSLSRLNSFPFDYVKIAKPFVDNIGDSQNESAVAKAIIGLADSLNLDAVAEGVEHEEQRRILSDMGCRLAQGFHFSRPMDAEQASAFLRATGGASTVPQVARP